MTELKACPFCGSAEIEQEETITDAAVICRNCGSRTGFVFLGASDAANAAKMREQRDLWNTRVLSTSLDRLRAALEAIRNDAAIERNEQLEAFCAAALATPNAQEQ